MSSERDLPKLRPGDLVAGRFRIVEIIGTGGFSVVYRAHQEGMNRFVALKVLKPRASADAKIVERFRREALFASQLSHPNTITLFDYGQTETGLCYIAMEHLVGKDLSEVVKNRRPVGLPRVWSILAQVCRSLAEAHKMGLIHRDLKPENVFLVERSGREHVKVLDFGVSKALSDFGDADASSLAPLTLEGTVFGTPLYMAPEQAMAEEITPAVDVYALGHMAYEMITGRAAYDRDISPMDVMLLQINDPPLVLPPPWDQTPFTEVIRQCTAKDPYNRVRNASRLLDMLMEEEFFPYMDLSELPPGVRLAAGPERGVLDMPGLEADAEEEQRTEAVYRWELAQLEEALEEVKRTSQTRLVVIRGKAGTGRSNLLRGFLKRYRNRAGIRVIHRESRPGSGEGRTPGLEMDLAQVASVRVKGEGIKEINRLLREVYSDNTLETMVEMAPVRMDSNPLSQLASRREDFLAKLVTPFRRGASVGTMIWGIEDLENVDPLTLAFLDRFIREMRVYPSPILLVVTVDPEALMERPGLIRHTEGILEAPSSYGRHLRLMEPGTLKEGEEGVTEEELLRLAEIPSDAAVDGSFLGMAKKRSTEDEEAELARWAALADGGEREPEVAAEAAPAAPDREPQKAEARAPEKRGTKTERLELFTTAESIAAAEEPSEVHEAFDRVLGYLAQLGDRVVERPLWEFVFPRVLPFGMTRIMGVILQHAERFGILVLTEEALAFTELEYARSLRQTFAELPGAREAHAQLAALLHEYSPRPGREALRRIVEHAMLGGDYKRGLQLLLRAGEEAFEDMDLDLAREYYLQFQSLVDELATRPSPPPEAFTPYPRVWLTVGQIQGALGEYGAAEDALRRCLQEASSKDHKERATASKILGDLALSQERFAEARQYFEEAHQLYHQTSLARPYVACLAEIGRCSMELGRPRQAEGILLQGLDKAQKLQDVALMARLHLYLGEVMTRQARFLESVDQLKRAMAIYEDRGDFKEVLLCLEKLGRANYAAGLYTESRANATRALAIASTRGIQAEDSPHLGLARSLAALENLEQAEVHLVEAMSFYGTRNQPIQRARVQFHLGDLYLAMGRASLAEEHYEHVFQHSKRLGHRQLAFDALVRRAYALYDQEKEGECFQVLIQAVEFGAESGDREKEVIARAHIIYLQLLKVEFQVKGEAFSTLFAEADERQVLASQGLCDFFRADLAMARGALREASSLLAKARLVAASLGEYGLFIPIERREYRIGKELGRLMDPHGGSGYSLGAVLAPEAGRRRFSSAWLGRK